MLTSTPDTRTRAKHMLLVTHTLRGQPDRTDERITAVIVIASCLRGFYEDNVSRHLLGLEMEQLINEIGVLLVLWDWRVVQSQRPIEHEHLGVLVHTRSHLPLKQLALELS
jgi:hypothetical protein